MIVTTVFKKSLLYINLYYISRETLMQIEIKNIQKHYGKRTVLQDISLQANSGDCIAILGLNGCGKSTLLSILAGILQPDSGSFLCDGVDLFKNPKQRSAVVGYIPQGTPLLEELSAKDNLLLWYSCAEKDLKSDLESGVPAILGVSEFINTTVSQMSGGMKKRLSIACAVAHSPKILLLDESSAALDLVCKEKLHAYFQLFLRQGGIILMITHDAQDLSICNQYQIMKDGIFHPYKYNGDLSTLTENL